MEDEVERAVRLLSQVEHAGHVVVILDVARGDQLGADRIGQLANASFHLVAGQVGKTELRPFGQELLCDRPGDAEIIRHAQDHPFFPRKQSHPRPLSPVLHQKTRLAYPLVDVSVVKYRDSPAHSTSTFQRATGARSTVRGREMTLESTRRMIGRGAGILAGRCVDAILSRAETWTWLLVAIGVILRDCSSTPKTVRCTWMSTYCCRNLVDLPVFDFSTTLVERTSLPRRAFLAIERMMVRLPLPRSGPAG